MNNTFEKTIQGRTLDLDLKDAGSGDESLSMLSTDLFIIIMNMTPDVDMGTEQEMRRILRHYIDRFEDNCTSGGIDSQKRNFAKYALVALIDEKALALPKKWAALWSAHPLQFDYFSDMVAGERFFEYLEQLLQQPQKYLDVLEVYYLCLCLGFKGKYGSNKAAIEDQIVAVARIILKHRPTVKVPQSPIHADHEKRRQVPNIPTWTIAAATASLLFLLWLGCHLTINNQSAKILPSYQTFSGQPRH
jgi:type VI secretion system protein ImpK